MAKKNNNDGMKPLRAMRTVSFDNPDPDLPEYVPPRREAAINKALGNSNRLGRITGPNGEGYDPNRVEMEYGTTDDFRAAKAAREAGVPVNRYPGKCVHCDKSIKPMEGEAIPIHKVPQEKRRGTSGFAVQCQGASCLTAKGKVRGSGKRVILPAQGVTVNKTTVGKKGSGFHTATLLHEGNESSLAWHPRTGYIQSMNIHPEHAGIGAEEHLMSQATSVARRQGFKPPVYKPTKGTTK